MTTAIEGCTQADYVTLTVEETAEALRISRGKAYQLCRTGAIPTLRFGRAIRVPKQVVTRMLDAASARVVG